MVCAAHGRRQRAQRRDDRARGDLRSGALGIEFDTEAEAVAIANDTPYGLASSLYTENLNVAHRVARELQAGVVAVNCYSEGDMTTPFGGYKLSGFGGHDKSVHAHHQYTETKTIWIQLKAAG